MKKGRAGAAVRMIAALSFFFFFSVNGLNAAEQNPPEWTVAARAFTVRGVHSGGGTQNPADGYTVAELLPRLILEQLEDAGSRSVPPDELYRRRLKELLKERRGLYAQLEQTVYERDKLIASSLNEKQLRTQIELKEKDSDSVRIKLDNLFERESTLSAADFKTQIEKIVLWKKNPAELYPAGQNGDFKEPEDICALIGGIVEQNGSFLQATVFLTLYPGGQEVLRINEVQTFDNLEALARSLAAHLIFALQNSKKIRLVFDIPADTNAEKTSIRIDGRLLHVQREGDGIVSAEVRSGIHEIYAETEGYVPAAFVYNFSSADEFYVRIDPEMREDKAVAIRGAPLANYSLFFDGLAAKLVPETGVAGNASDVSVFRVNGFPVLAELSTEEGSTVPFMLSLKNSASPGIPEYALAFKKSSAASGIEKKRSIMYNSYTALIVSLPFTFILLGKQVDEYNSWARGNNVKDDLEKWNIAYYTAAGVSVGLGINFLVQLALYLHTANAVLPKEVFPKQKTR